MGNMTAIGTAGNIALKALRTVSIFVSCALVVACSAEDNSKLYARLNEIKARPADKIPSLPTFKPYETFQYSKDDKNDPFKMFAAEQVAAAEVSVESPLAGRNREALEQYPLDTIRYVGQLIKDGNEWAIVTSPDLIVHRVKVGNYLGQNYGKIVAIKEDKILIEETIPSGMGGWITRDAALSLME